MASEFRHGKYTLKFFCEALGLDWENDAITGITIDVDVKDVARVTIRRIMTVDEAGGLCSVVQDLVAGRLTSDEDGDTA